MQRMQLRVTQNSASTKFRPKQKNIHIKDDN